MTQATDDVYYLYVGNGWSGPFRLEQIKLFVKEKQITPETFAFEPQQQMQLTVGQLLADPSEANTGAYQSATAPEKQKGPKSTRMDAFDAKQTQVNVKSDAKSSKSAKAKKPKNDDDEIDLTITTSTPNSKNRDDDSFDLDAGASTVKGKYEDDSFDLDSPKTTVKGKFDEDSFDIDAADLRDAPLEVQVDEPAGRPAGKTSQGQPYQPQAGSQDALEVVLGELENLRRAYNSLMENSIKDREEAQGKVHIAHLAINEVLEERKADIAEVRSLIAEIDEVASDLAKQHKDKTLSTRIIKLRDSLHDTDVSQMVQFAEAVLRRIVEQSDRQAPGQAKADDPFSAFDSSDAVSVRPPSSKTLANTARVELNNTQIQLAELKKAYDQLHDSHTQGQHAAREELLKATAMLENEQHAHEQDAAEARSLAAEIYRLACELDPKQMAPELAEKISRLWEELGKEEQTTAVAPVAEDVLIGLVKGLRDQGAKPVDPPTGEISSLKKQVKDLGALRAELLQTRTDLSMMRQREQALQEEKVRLQGLLDEQKQISEKAQQAAKAREQRLRSTVCALEVTKELHQEVMRDLQTQLGGAQNKVEEMEQELRKVRGDLTSRRAKKDQGTDLHAEMRRVVELRALLDARKHELSADLKSTEAELQRVTSDPSAAEDHSLAEMLAAKVNSLRTTYEQTQKRLNDQEAKALALQNELEASRREAGELRGRSDELNTELEGARANLSSAKKRAEELNIAYERLEAERESLHKELTHRKSTTRIFRSDGTEAPSDVFPIPDNELLAQVTSATVRAETLEAELARERRRAQDLSAEQEALQARIRELAQDRDHVRAELEKLTEERTVSEQRHADAMANATRAAIEAETHRAKAIARIAELERKTGSGAQTALASANPEAADPKQIDALKLELEKAREEAKNAISLLAAARAAVAATAFADAGKQISDQGRSLELAKRLAEAEKDVESAAGQRDDVQAKLAQSTQDRARLNAEIERLRRELESAANEHRASLSSARNRLVEEQERAQSVELELAEAKSQMQATASQRESINVTMAQAISAKDRLAVEVQRLAGQIADQSTDKAELTKRLEAEQAALARAGERISELERALAKLEADAADARINVPELEARLTRSLAERQQFLSELDRLRGELVTASQRREHTEASHADQQRLAAQAADSLRQLQEVGESRDRLQAHLDATKAELDRLRAEFATLSDREAAHADALSSAEGRLAIESTRYQTADQLLQQARDQYRTVSGERDQTRLELAESKVQRDQLESQLTRLRSELDQIKSRLAAPQSEQDHMQSIADKARIGGLEQEVQEAHRLLKDLALRETQRLAMVAAERDEFAREITALRASGAQPLVRDSVLGKGSASPLREPSQPPGEREFSLSGGTGATGARDKLKAITADFHRLDAALSELRKDPTATLRLLETTKRRLARARRRIRALEAGQDDALTSRGLAPANLRQPGQEDAELDALRRSASMLTSGGAASAFQTRTVAPDPAEPKAGADAPRIGAGDPATPRHARTSSRFFSASHGRAKTDPGFTQRETARKPFVSPVSQAIPSTDAHGNQVPFTRKTTAPSTRGYPSSRFATTMATARAWAAAPRDQQGPWLSRRVKIAGCVSASLLAIACGALFIGSLFPYSAQAVVNARVAAIKARIEGVIQPSDLQVGALVSADHAVVTIHNDHVDESASRALKRRAEDLQSRRDSILAEIAPADAALAAAEAAFAAEHEGFLAAATHELETANANLTALQQAEQARRIVMQVLESLAQAGKLQASDLAPFKQSLAESTTALATQQKALDDARAKVRAAGEEQEKSRKIRDENLDKVRSLHSTATAIDAEIAEVQDSLAVEQARVVALRDATISSPISGPIWMRKAAPGQMVRKDATVMEIADTTSIAIEAMMLEKHRSSVKVGERVRVHLLADDSIVPGTVTAILPAEGDGATMAHAFDSTYSNGFRVRVEFASTRPKADLIGQGCEIVVVGDHPWMESGFGWLFFRIKPH